MNLSLEPCWHYFMCAWVHAEQPDWITLSERAILHWESELDWHLRAPFLPSLTSFSWTVPRHVRMKISTCSWLYFICFSAHLCNKSCTRSRALLTAKPLPSRKDSSHINFQHTEALQDPSAEQAVGNLFVFSEPSIWLIVKYTLSHILSYVDTQFCPTYSESSWVVCETVFSMRKTWHVFSPQECVRMVIHEAPTPQSFPWSGN